RYRTCAEFVDALLAIPSPPAPRLEVRAAGRARSAEAATTDASDRLVDTPSPLALSQEHRTVAVADEGGDSVPRPPTSSGPPTTPTPVPDETTFGIPGYQLLDRVGRSATGEVWKAQADSGGVRFVKFLPGPLPDPAALETVLEWLRGLCHPGLGRADFLPLPGGRLAVVSADGQRTLADRLRE